MIITASWEIHIPVCISIFIQVGKASENKDKNAAAKAGVAIKANMAKIEANIRKKVNTYVAK
jgi:hypothetical protein